MLRFYNRICFEKQVDRLEIKNIHYIILTCFRELRLCLFEWRFSLKRGFTGLGYFHQNILPAYPYSYLFTMRN